MKRLFFGSKQEKLTDRSFTVMFMALVMGIAACNVALVAATWAWFEVSNSVDIPVIQSARYEISAEVDGAAVEGDNGNLSAGEAHSIALSAAGDAASGYVEFTLNGTKYVVFVPLGGTVSFTVYDANVSSFSFASAWGERAMDDPRPVIEDGYAIESGELKTEPTMTLMVLPEGTVESDGTETTGEEPTGGETTGEGETTEGNSGGTDTVTMNPVG